MAQMIICLQGRRPRLDPWVGKIPGGGHGNPLQYPCLENPMDRGYSPWGRKESDMTDWHTPPHTPIVGSSGRICLTFFYVVWYVLSRNHCLGSFYWIRDAFTYKWWILPLTSVAVFCILIQIGFLSNKFYLLTSHAHIFPILNLSY